MNCAVPAPHALGKLYQMLSLMMTVIGVMAKYILSFLYSHKCGSQESIVDKGTRLWAVWSRVYIPAGARDLSLLQNTQTLWSTPSLLFSGCWGTLVRVWHLALTSVLCGGKGGELYLHFTIHLHGMYCNIYWYLCPYVFM